MKITNKTPRKKKKKKNGTKTAPPCATTLTSVQNSLLLKYEYELCSL